MSARDVLIRFECREQCAEKGEPPCFELDEELESEDTFYVCDLCARLTDARLVALAAAGYKVLGREPTPEMVYAGSASCLDWDQADEWRAMFDAAQPATEQKE
jgi:hypothetical protein